MPGTHWFGSSVVGQVSGDVRAVDVDVLDPLKMILGITEQSTHEAN